MEVNCKSINNVVEKQYNFIMSRNIFCGCAGWGEGKERPRKSKDGEDRPKKKKINKFTESWEVTSAVIK